MRRFFAVLVAVWVALLSGMAGAQGDFPTLIAPDSLLSEGERATLQRDADLAQRSGVPIMFVVIQGDGTSAGSAESIAGQIRADYGVETSAGADDGIVFVLHWIPTNPSASPIVYSAGANAFDTTGLSDETITSYIEDHVQPWIDRGEVFESGAYLIRFTRYTSLYVPPPVREISGPAKTVQQILTVAAPLLMIGATGAMWRLKNPTERRRYTVVAITLLAALVMGGLSVWTHSRIGIAGVAITLVALAGWCLWTTRDRRSDGVKWKTVLPDIAIVAVVIAVSFFINARQADVTPSDRDETRWISRAHYAADLRDPFGPTWQDYSVTIGQPPLGSIAIGIGLALQGDELGDVATWDYQYNRDWYEATGGAPTEDKLHTARNTNVVIGALTTGAAYVLGRLLTNRVGGIAAGMYVAWHPLHIVLSTQALSDETFVFLLMLAFIAAYQFAAKPTWARAIALGILLGLGGATKLTPLLLTPPLAVYGLVTLWLNRTPTGKRAGWMLIAQPFIAFAAFVAAYPFLWPNPIERTWRLFAFRSSEMDAQTSAWPNAMVEGPLHALARFGHKLTYTHSPSQRAMQQVYDWIGIDRAAVGVDLVFVAAGAVILLWLVARHGIWTPHALVAALMFGELAILAIGMKADFYRYHLPVAMIASGFIAVFAGYAWKWIAILVTNRTRNPGRHDVAEVAT